MQPVVQGILTTPVLLAGDQDFLNVPVFDCIHKLPDLAMLLMIASFFVIFFHGNFLLFGLVRCIIHSHLYPNGILQPEKHAGNLGQ